MSYVIQKVTAPYTYWFNKDEDWTKDSTKAMVFQTITLANEAQQLINQGFVVEREDEIPKPNTITKREKILRDAITCVTKDRNATHGNPEDNFAIIANLWNIFLEARGCIIVHRITVQDIATMMILMKISRIIKSPDHEDHWIDIAGYAACAGGIINDKIS